MDELRERVDTLKYLEEEASEENEILKFKVLSLEGQASIEGQDMSELKILDELKLAKRDLQSELDVLRTQVKSFKLLFGSVETINEDDVDPMIQLGSLKLLYDMHKLELPDEDLSHVLTTLYLGEQSAYRYYRERLFEKVAKKAIEQAEFLYKSRGANTDSKQ